jgi:exosome complex RNA-binding protein Csl4
MNQKKEKIKKLLVTLNSKIYPGLQLARTEYYEPGEGCYSDDKHIIASKIGFLHIDNSSPQISKLNILESKNQITQTQR